jgi:hypothetical protein
MNKLEINYEIVGLFDVAELVKSPNLTISVGLIISVVLGPNVFSIENHKTRGNIKLDGGAVAINGEWVYDGLGYTPFLFPLEFTESVTYAKLG